MSLFERWLTLWVALCIVAGVALGHLMPGAFHLIGALEVAKVNLPVAVLIWLMIVPMLIRIDFAALSEVGQHWRGIGVTLFINWAVKPFSMAALGWLFVVYLFGAAFSAGVIVWGADFLGEPDTRALVLPEAIAWAARGTAIVLGIAAAIVVAAGVVMGLRKLFDRPQRDPWDKAERMAKHIDRIPMYTGGVMAVLVPIVVAGVVADTAGVQPVLILGGIAALLAAAWSQMRSSRIAAPSPPQEHRIEVSR